VPGSAGRTALRAGASRSDALLSAHSGSVAGDGETRNAGKAGQTCETWIDANAFLCLPVTRCDA
jgi:hypothetical protein